jgi:DNA-binding transcriptional MerR regulator
VPNTRDAPGTASGALSPAEPGAVADGAVPPGDGPWRIGDLARESALSVRNIREYQDRGLLPAPRRDGRVAWYDEEHLVRLRLISRLLDRGYTIAVIRDLLDAWSAGRDLHDVLGLETTVSRPWTDEEPGRATLLQLRRRFRGQLTPGRLRRTVRLGLVVPSGAAFTIPSPRLLDAGTDLVAAGIPLATVLDMVERVQRDLRSPADRFVRMVFDQLLPPDSPEGLPTGDELPEVTRTVEKLRPHAQLAVSALFARAMRSAVDDAVDAVARRALAGHDAAEGRGAS